MTKDNKYTGISIQEIREKLMQKAEYERRTVQARESPKFVSQLHLERTSKHSSTQLKTSTKKKYTRNSTSTKKKYTRDSISRKLQKSSQISVNRKPKTKKKEIIDSTDLLPAGRNIELIKKSNLLKSSSSSSLSPLDNISQLTPEERQVLELLYRDNDLLGGEMLNVDYVPTGDFSDSKNIFIKEKSALDIPESEIIPGKRAEHRKKNKPKKFRIRSKSLYLTYSQIPILPISDREYEQMVLEMLQTILGHIEEYIIRIEKHVDEGLHMHCFLKRSTRFEIFSADKLDLDLRSVLMNDPYFSSSLEDFQSREDEGVLHGNYQAGRSQRDIVSYILKDVNIDDPQVIDEMISTYRTFHDLKRFYFESPKDHLLKVYQESGYEAMQNIFIHQYPELFVSQGSKILQNFKLMDGVRQQNSAQNSMFISNLNNYDDLPAPIGKWAAVESSEKALVLYGPSGTGKTELAKSISMYLLNRTPALLSDINSLANYKNQDSICIIFDDLDFDGISREKKIHLTDLKETRDIRVLYGTTPLKSTTPRIFTTNHVTHLNSDEAIRRRCSYVEIKKSYYKHTRTEIVERTFVQEFTESEIIDNDY